MLLFSKSYLVNMLHLSFRPFSQQIPQCELSSSDVAAVCWLCGEVKVNSYDYVAVIEQGRCF